MTVAVDAESGYDAFIINTNGFYQQEPGTPGDEPIQILHSAILPPKECAQPEGAV